MTDQFRDELPDPEIVARAAAQTAAPRVLEDYIEAIGILRNKKFTFREIAEWLKKQFDIQADHNSVWRAYTKYMDSYQAHLEDQADEEMERDEAMAEAARNGTFSVVSTPIPPATVTTSPELAGAEKPKAVGRKRTGKKKN